MSDEASPSPTASPHKGNGIDFTSGPLFKKMLLFVLPLLLLSIAQMVFYSLDQLIVSNFGEGDTSFAAVSASNSIVNLLIGSFLGISVGANIVLAQALGKKDAESARKAVQSSLLLSIFIGTAVAVIGIPLSRYFLIWMATPEVLLDKATVYLQCCFGGMPFLMIFNFGAACFRATGEGKRPLIVLLIAGALNVSLNLLFVLGFKMQTNGQDVLAVGLTTLISQAVQALLIVIFLHRSKNPYSHLEYKGIALYKKETQLLLKHGLMAGLQFFIFSISNLIIQRSVNGYSDDKVSRLVAMNGNAAAMQLEGYIAMVLKTFGVACTIMTAQNRGARNKKNLIKILWMTLLTSTLISITMSGLAVLLYKPLVSLFLPQKAFASSSDYDTSLEVAHGRLLVIALFYFVDAWMDNISGYCRGLGHPYAPSVVTFFATTVYRLTFIFAVWSIPGMHTLPWLWSTWPISWGVAVLLYATFMPRFIKKAFHDIDEEEKEKASSLPSPQ